jgi:hypothetical protein
MWPFSKEKLVDVTNPLGINIENRRDDPPEFPRTYTALATSGVVVIIKSWQSRFDFLYQSGELMQPDGKSVTFTPDKIADEIIDSDLLPSVKEIVKQILKIDAAFRKTKPSEFIDDKGVTWVRKEKL